MPVQNVRADIVDLSRDQPRANDEFVLDTNSWKELTYSRLLQPKPAYPAYVKKALTEGATLYASGVTLIELASVIESNEWEVYQQRVGQIERKDFRHDCDDARATVIAEISSSWSQVMQIAKLIDLNLNGPATERLLSTLKACRVDGYDTMLIEAMTKRGVFNIVTHDGDFATVPEIKVFTANTHILAIARRQGRLLNRR